MAETRLVQQLRLTQQLVMTPQLRQAIKILQVSRAELETLVDDELTQNPVLEEQQPDEKPESEVPTVDGQSVTEEWRADAPQEEVPQASTIDQMDGREFAENYSNDMRGSGGGAMADDDDRRPALENTLVRRTHLPDHLVWQLRLADLSDADKELGALIIGSLDPDGYL